MPITILRCSYFCLDRHLNCSQDLDSHGNIQAWCRNLFLFFVPKVDVLPNACCAAPIWHSLHGVLWKCTWVCYHTIEYDLATATYGHLFDINPLWHPFWKQWCHYQIIQRVLCSCINIRPQIIKYLAFYQDWRYFNNRIHMYTSANLSTAAYMVLGIWLRTRNTIILTVYLWRYTSK